MTAQPKPADKVWARDRRRQNAEWFEVDESYLRSVSVSDDSVWGFFERHVGPTPPSANEPAMQELSDLGQAFDAAPDADGGLAHDGSPKRPTDTLGADVAMLVKTAHGGMTRPADAIHDATADIDDLVSQIRIAIRSWRGQKKPYPTDSQAQAFIGLRSNLTVALAAFQGETGQ